MFFFRSFLTNKHILFQSQLANLQQLPKYILLRVVIFRGSYNQHLALKHNSAPRSPAL